MILLRDGFEGATHAADFGKDFLGRFCPDEGFGVGIVMVEVVVDGCFEFGHRGENTAPDAVMSDQAEEALDLVEPRCRGRGEVQVKARVLVEPRRHLGVLMGGIVVEHEVEIEFGRVWRSMVRKKRRNS